MDDGVGDGAPDLLGLHFQQAVPGENVGESFLILSRDIVVFAPVSLVPAVVLANVAQQGSGLAFRLQAGKFDHLHSMDWAFHLKNGSGYVQSILALCYT